MGCGYVNLVINCIWNRKMVGI